MGFGIQQPTGYGFLQLHLPADCQPAVIRDRLATLPGLESVQATHYRNDSIRQVSELLLQIHQVLQREAKIPVFSRPFLGGQSSGPELNDKQPYRVFFATPYVNSIATRNALTSSLTIINLYLSRYPNLPDTPVLMRALTQSRNNIRQLGNSGLNTLHFIGAALNLSIPITPIVKNTVSFGLGKNSRWLDSSFTDETPVIGVAMAKNKHYTSRVLRKMGLPVPDHELVTTEAGALKAARNLGYPVVVKPADLDRGDGVSAGLLDDHSVRTAFQTARRLSSLVMVEEHIEGEDFRFTVLHDRVIKIIHRRPGGLIGDGKQTVMELFDEFQNSEEFQDIVRREGKPRLKWDDEAEELLTEQGLTAQSIPQRDQFVRLRRKCNISTGGSYQVVPMEAVHEDNLNLARRAAQVLGLDLAGVDLLTTDASKPWHSCQARICEVNAKPQIGLRHTPEIYKQILQQLVPGNGLIPVRICIVIESGTGALNSEAHYRKLLSAVAASGSRSAVSCRFGVWVDGQQQVWNPTDSYAAAQALLLDRRVESAIIFLTSEDLLRHGLPTGEFNSVELLCDSESEQRAPVKATVNHIRLLVEPYNKPVRLINSVEDAGF